MSITWSATQGHFPYCVHNVVEAVGLADYNVVVRLGSWDSNPQNAVFLDGAIQVRCCQRPGILTIYADHFPVRIASRGRHINAEGNGVGVRFRLLPRLISV
jgi:hypothetical protein